MEIYINLLLFICDVKENGLNWSRVGMLERVFEEVKVIIEFLRCVG